MLTHLTHSSPFQPRKWQFKIKGSTVALLILSCILLYTSAKLKQSELTITAIERASLVTQAKMLEREQNSLIVMAEDDAKEIASLLSDTYKDEQSARDGIVRAKALSDSIDKLKPRVSAIDDEVKEIQKQIQ